MIAVRNVTKGFGSLTAVNNLSFDAPNGTITGLLGSNGAGKTTVLRIIAGALAADAGTVTIDGVDPRRDRMASQPILGALLDHAGLYDRLTVRENLEYFARLRGMKPASIETAVGRVLATLGLDAVADRRALRLSRGERMKLALGRAVLHDPPNLLLDEPTNGLDVPAVRALRDVLGRLRRSGATVIFSSHVLGEVEAVCDRVVVIARGARVADGTVDALRARAASGGLEEAFVTVTRDTGEAVC